MKDLKCPKCGKSSIYTKIRTQVRVCKLCGHQWPIIIREGVKND